MRLATYHEPGALPCIARLNREHMHKPILHRKAPSRESATAHVLSATVLQHRFHLKDASTMTSPSRKQPLRRALLQ